MAKKEKIYEVIVEIVKDGNKMIPQEVNSGEFIADKIPYGARKYALEGGWFLGKSISAAGNTFWRRIDKIPENYKTGRQNIGEITKDRFTTLVDIPLLTEIEEYNLLKLLYPKSK